MRRNILLFVSILFAFNFAQAQHFGNCLDFDGEDDWVDCSNNNGQKTSYTALGLPTSAITVEAWFFSREYDEWQSMVSFFQDNGSEEYGWSLETGNVNSVGFAIRSASNEYLTYLYTEKEFPLNEWHHIAGTYDGTEMRVYVDGKLEATSNNQSGDIQYIDSWLSIGMYKDDDEDYGFSGSIDEVRIWNYARSNTEIIMTMNKELTGNEENLVAYYNFNQGNSSVFFFIIA